MAIFCERKRNVATDKPVELKISWSYIAVGFFSAMALFGSRIPSLEH